MRATGCSPARRRARGEPRRAPVACIPFQERFALAGVTVGAVNIEVDPECGDAVLVFWVW